MKDESASVKQMATFAKEKPIDEDEEQLSAEEVESDDLGDDITQSRQPARTQMPMQPQQMMQP